MTQNFVKALLVTTFFCTQFLHTAQAQPELVPPAVECLQLAGVYLEETGIETKRQANIVWFTIPLAAWIYVEPYSGTAVTLWYAIQRLYSAYNIAHLQTEAGRLLQGKSDSATCKAKLSQEQTDSEPTQSLQLQN